MKLTIIRVLIIVIIVVGLVSTVQAEDIQVNDNYDRALQKVKDIDSFIQSQLENMNDMTVDTEPNSIENEFESIELK